MKKRQRGFTLVELLVVIAIIAIVLAIALPAFASLRGAARITACLAGMRSIQQAGVARNVQVFNVEGAGGTIGLGQLAREDDDALLKGLAAK